MATIKWEDEDKPRFITSRYDGRCKECDTDIKEGDRVLWDPKTRKVYCETCGEDYA